MQRTLSILLPCVAILSLAIALRSGPAAEPARAAALPASKTAPAIGPSEVKQAAAQSPAAAGSSATPAAAAGGEGRAAESKTPVADPTGKGPVLSHCLVKLIQEVQVPGIEAGVLMSLEAKEGMDVRFGTTLGHVDDRQPTMDMIISKIKHDAAKAEAENDIDIRYARKAADVAKYEWLKNKEAIGKVPGAISGVDVKKTELAAEKAILGIEQAIVKQRQLIYESDTKGTEVEAAELSIKRRKIVAPFDGVVTNVYRHPGEWVAPGDPVIKVVQMDRLRIEGFLSAAEYDPPEIDGRPVSIEAELAHGRKVKFTGKVVFVSPLVSAGGEYVVFAEVNNRQENGQWVLRPGLYSTMTIHLK